MLYRFIFGNSDPVEVQQLDAIHNALRHTGAGQGDEYPLVDTPICEVLPLRNIPVECEDERVHDGVNPCGDPECYCASYGYGVTSLYDPRES